MKPRSMKRSAALIATAALVVAACGGDDGDDADEAPTESETTDAPADTGDDADEPDTTDAPADTADTGDDADEPDTTADTGDDGAVEGADPTAILRYGQMRADSLDPIRQGVPCESTVLYTIFDTLVSLDSTGTPQPMLAESWEAMDGDVLRLNLRTDVTFHDGTPFDADAVVFNIDRVLNDPDSNIASQLTSVEGATVVDDSTVDLQLSGPAYAPTLAGLGDRAGMMASPTAVEAAGGSDDFSRAPVGAGPFRIEGDWAPRESASVRAVEDYWDPSAQNIAGIDFTELTQDWLNTLRAGDMDVVALQPLDIVAIEGDDDYKVTTGTTLTYRAFIMNETLEPFDDERVRQAVAHAIDREAIAQIQLQGIGEPSYQFVPPSSFAYDPALDDVYTYDPDRARELLAEAGYEDGLAIESAIGSSATSYVQTGELVQAQLAEVGIDMDLQLIDAAAAIPRLFNEGPDGTGDLPSSPFGGAATADPDAGLRNIFSAEGSFNAGGNEPPGLIDLLDEAASTVDPDERAALYQEANRIAVEGVWHGVPLFFEVSGTGTQDYVGGVDDAISACFAPQDFFRDVYISEGREPIDG